MTEQERLPLGLNTGFNLFSSALEYMVDAAQRTVLFADVMHQRGQQYHDHIAKTAPHVLDYEAELLIDGRTLQRPVNYALARIVPPADVMIDETRRPFVVVDPRAAPWSGHRQLQSRQRDRRYLQGRACLLFHRLPAGADAGTDD